MRFTFKSLSFMAESVLNILNVICSTVLCSVFIMHETFCNGFENREENVSCK